MSVLRPVFIYALVCTSGCAAPADDEATDAPTDATDLTDAAAPTDDEASTDLPDATDITDEPAPITRKTLTGQVSWHVDFRKDSVTDCTYTRNYVGVEDRSIPWMCPEGCLAFQSPVIADGLDCMELANGSAQYAPVEVIAQAESGFWRMLPGHTTLNGAVTPAGAGFDFTDSFDGGTTVGKATFTRSGHFDYWEEEGEATEIVAAASYTCGWPRANPPPYVGPYGYVELGGVLPDAVFRDHCDEFVRLHDFKGRYIVLTFAAIDCGPCQVEANILPEFERWAVNQGYEVSVVTVLAEGLAQTGVTPTLASIEAWRTEHGLSGPVLADRGYGGVMQARNFPDDRGYPGFMLFAPDLTHVGSGYGDVVSTAKDLIRAHAAANP